MAKHQDDEVALWSNVLGATALLGLTSILGLTAVGGWFWVAKFLESSAPAWIQAVGSVAAIVAAIAIVQRQHTLETSRKRDDDRIEQCRRIRILRIIFFTAARTCESVARSIGRPNVYWPMEASKLREVRARLLSIDPMQIPLGRLVLLVEECVMLLQTCTTLVDELATPRSKEIEAMIQAALMKCARECWLGLYEATSVDASLAGDKDVAAGLPDFDDFAASRKELDKIRAEFEKASTTAALKPNNEYQRPPTGAAE